MSEHVRSALSWIEVWALVQPSQPAKSLQAWLRGLQQDPALGPATRRVFGNDTEQRAGELANLIRSGVEGHAHDWSPILALLRSFGSALAESGAAYTQVQRLASSLRMELTSAWQPPAASDLVRAARALGAMHEAIDLGIGAVGEEYLRVREDGARVQRDRVETALRSSELRFRRLFEAGILGILVCDVAGNIKEANDGFLNMVGYTREDLASGRVRWLEMTPPEWRHHDDDAIEQLKARGVTKTWEKEYLCKDGSRVPIMVGVAMLDDQDCIAFVLDITERRRLEALRVRSAALEAQTARIQESSRLKNEFLANMSHELRTPLNSIIGFADVLYDGEVPTDSPKHHELLGDILRSGRHLLQLINDVLDLAKVEAGKLDFRPEPVDLSQLVSEVAAILRSISAGKQIHIETEIDPELDYVTLDPARLKQVLYNYVSNALKFTGPSGRVIIRATPEGDDQFRISVEDTGIGIAQDDLPRLFIEFQQLDAGSAKKHAGTGLGLALTKRIVEAQAGSIGVTSAVGKGSTFFAILPRHSDEIVFEDVEQSAPLMDSTASAVLVIEDDARDRRLLTRILTEAGYGVDQAATGAQAIASCNKRVYNAITLDLLLPDTTGLEILHNIRLSGANQMTPVVIVSVVAEKGVVGGYPVQDYLTKPVSSQTLLECLRKAQVIAPADGKIWVVDDDPASLKLMETVLSQLGYHASCQPNPALALERLEHEQPVAIVLDLMMPNIDGFEFLARLRQKPEHDKIPVIVWTMKDLTSEDHKRLHRVAQAVLLKGHDGNQSLAQQMRLLLERAIGAMPARVAIS